MKKMLLLISLLYSIAITAQTDSERMDEVMQAAQNTGLFNGVVLVARHDSILLFKGYGWRNIEHKILHDTNSVFQIGSVTKQFTATIILWLQEHHRLNIQDKLSKYYPQYLYADKITLHNLLTHTSGLPEYTDQYFLVHQADKAFTQQDFWNIIKDKPLDFEPDSEFGYRNTNYTLLGYIIEKVSGKTYEQMVRQIIFNKAGMTHSGFDFAHLASPARSTGYEDLSLNTPKHTRIGDSSATFAAGAIYTTAGDLYRWHKALYGNTIISQASLEQAFTPYKANYGYGWTIDYAAGKRFQAHNGYNWGFQTLFKRYPSEGACMIILQNEDKLTFDNYALSIERILFHDPNYYIPRNTITLSYDSLQKFTGSYELTDNPAFKAEIIVSSQGHLLLTWSNMKPEEIFAEKKDFFHFRSYNMQLIFIRNEKGQLSGFSAVNGKQVFKYKKII